MENYNKAASTGETYSVQLQGESSLFGTTIAAATTLTAKDSGKTFLLAAAAGAAIALPALGLWKFKFITGSAFATTNWTIVSATNVIQGHVIVNGAPVVGADENTISLVATAETIGDFVEVECDGTNVYAFGSGVVAGSITFTAP
jgi:carbohydrate-binding DOMON domain-containing protein